MSSVATQLPFRSVSVGESSGVSVVVDDCSAQPASHSLVSDESEPATVGEELVATYSALRPPRLSLRTTLTP